MRRLGLSITRDKVVTFSHDFGFLSRDTTRAASIASVLIRTRPYCPVNVSGQAVAGDHATVLVNTEKIARDRLRASIAPGGRAKKIERQREEEGQREREKDRGR